MKNKKPLITIITCLYNKEKYIDKWAFGLSIQTYLDKMKILVIENCSTDNSYEVMQEQIKKYNLPAELIRNEKNIGLMGSTMKGYRMIDTKYWAVLDPDDYYLSPKKVEKAVKYLEAHEDFVCYGCNQVLQFADGSKQFYVPLEAKSQVVEKGMIFFQTASATFRNFWTQELLDAMERWANGAPKHPLEADGFRHFISWHFGKHYFDSSPDSCYLVDIGMWGTLTRVEQDLKGLDTTIFEFYRELYGVDEVALWNLNQITEKYNECVDNLSAVLKDFSAHKLTFTQKTEDDKLPLDVVFAELKKTCEFLGNLKENGFQYKQT